MLEIRGNFENALLTLIGRVIDNKISEAYCGKPEISSSSILAEWDSIRGTDWFTSTRRGEANLKKEEK